jgi:hypothetical protein
MSQEFQRPLRIGNRQGSVVIRNGRAHDCYCVKVLSSREPPSDAALASRSIFIGMSPTARQMPLLYPVTAEQIAANFQAKLLMFRLQNFDRLDASRPLSAAIEDLTPRVRDLGRAFGVPLLGNADLEKALGEILREQDRDARVHRALEPEWLRITRSHGPATSATRRRIFCWPARSWALTRASVSKKACDAPVIGTVHSIKRASLRRYGAWVRVKASFRFTGPGSYTVAYLETLSSGFFSARGGFREGVRATKVSVIENGELITYLLGRQPIRDFPESNGHGRATPGRFPAQALAI